MNIGMEIPQKTKSKLEYKIIAMKPLVLLMCANLKK
jgi:hypothetical protein